MGMSMSMPERRIQLRTGLRRRSMPVLPVRRWLLKCLFDPPYPPEDSSAPLQTLLVVMNHLHSRNRAQ